MALITLALFKQFLGISGTSEDTLLQIYVDAADAFIKNYTHRDLESVVYSEEKYNGSGTRYLVLRQYPLISVEEILDEDEDEVEEKAIDELEEDGYFIWNADAAILANTICWEVGVWKYTISYTAGYATIPADLKLAALAVASYMRNTSQKVGIRSESLGSYSYSLSNDLMSMGNDLVIPDINVTNILNRYRMRYVCTP